jgi:hypothetical protein
MVRVQRVVMPSGVESATVLRGGSVVEPIERFLAHLTAIERSPNTVKAYAHDLRDYFEFLEHHGLQRDRVVLEDLGRFVAWLRLPGGARDGRVAMLPWVDPKLAAADSRRGLKPDRESEQFSRQTLHRKITKLSFDPRRSFG